MADLYGNFVNGSLVDGPRILPTTWKTPEGDTITGFDLLLINDPESLKFFNWYIVDNSSIDVYYNTDYENIVYSAWFLENDIIKRNYTFVNYAWTTALTIAFNKLDKNRHTYEVSGFEYDYYGIPVKVYTDRESSQPKIMASRLAVTDGDRYDTDVYKFTKIDDGSALVVQLPNEKLLEIKSLVYRKIQDSYNLQSQIAWQMLGTGDTETLRSQIEDKTINLNPWVNDSSNDLPWVY